MIRWWLDFWRKPTSNWGVVSREVESLYTLLRSVDVEVNQPPLVGVCKTEWRVFDANTGTCRYVYATYHLANGEVHQFKLAFHKPVCHMFITGAGSSVDYKVITVPLPRYDSIAKEIRSMTKRIRECTDKLGSNNKTDITHIEIRNPATPRVLKQKELQ